MTKEPMHILFIDDEAQFLASISKILAISGYKVTQAINGTAALDALDEDTFSIALMDRTLPDYEGEALALAFNEKTPDLPILMLSGFDSSDMIGNPANVVGALIKPFRAAELIDAIKVHCG